MKKIFLFVFILGSIPITSFAATASVETRALTLYVELDKSLFDFLESKGIDSDLINRTKIANLIAQRVSQSLNPILDGLPLYNIDRYDNRKKASIKLVIRVPRNPRIKVGGSYSVQGAGGNSNNIDLIYNTDAFWDVFQEGNESRPFFTDKVLHSVVVFFLQYIAEHYLVQTRGVRYSEYSLYGRAYRHLYNFNRGIEQHAFSKTGAMKDFTRRLHLPDQDKTLFLQTLSGFISRGLIAKAGLVNLSIYQDSYRRSMEALQNFVASNEYYSDPDIMASLGHPDQLLLTPYLEKNFSSAAKWIAPSCEEFLAGEVF